MNEQRSMASRNLRAEVVDLIADERGLSREKVQPSSRLSQNLGMDGDDAVDFFTAVHERFGTDLTHLHAHWNEHFAPEGFSGWYGLIFIACAVVAGSVTGAADLSSFWGLTIGGALIVGSLRALRR